MPEGPEIDTDKLHEEIQEKAHEEGGSFLRRIAVTTALFAALAAIASLNAGGTVNEALVLKTEATRLQAQASDQWAYFQAKGIKASIQENAMSSWESAGKTAPPALAEKAKHYAEEQEEINKKAIELEAERDKKSEEADHLLHRHHRYASTVALLQIAIALGAVAALTRSKPVWVGSLLTGITGLMLFVSTVLL